MNNNARFPYYLANLNYNVLYMNILAIGAHPDDIELGCGGLILKAARNGQRIYVYLNA